MIRSLLRALLVVALLCLASPLATYAQNEPATSSVEPTAGGPGTVFTFTATFERGDRVGYFFTRPDGTVDGNIDYNFELDEDRRTRTWRWTAPADAQPGLWRMTARPITGDGTLERQVIVPFTIVGQAQPQPLSAGVSPTSGPAGTRFSFSASGFEPGEIASFWLTTPAAESIGDEAYVIYVDENGRGSWEWQAPANAQSGNWLMVAQGRNSRIERTISFTLTSGAVAPPVKPAAVEPAAGPPGTAFRFAISGFAPNEKLNYWLSSPAGQAIGADEYVAYADEDGVAIINWTAPADAARGVWLMVGQGVDSRRTLTERFTVSN